MLKNKKLIITILLLIISTAVLWWFIGRRDNSENAETSAYRYQLVECSSIISTLEGVGTRPCDR